MVEVDAGIENDDRLALPIDAREPWVRPELIEADQRCILLSKRLERVCSGYIDRIRDILTRNVARPYQIGRYSIRVGPGGRYKSFGRFIHGM